MQHAPPDRRQGNGNRFDFRRIRRAEALIRAALSTYSLPVALGDAANKVLLACYAESPATWRAFAAIKSANDFKDHTGVRPSQTGDLEELAVGGFGGRND